MSRWIASLGLLLALSTGALAKTIRVRAHANKKSGAYTDAHVRTAPNGTRTDNFSSRGNVNPYTGRAGTKDPYAPKKPGRSRAR